MLRWRSCSSNASQCKFSQSTGSPIYLLLATASREELQPVPATLERLVLHLLALRYLLQVALIWSLTAYSGGRGVGRTGGADRASDRSHGNLYLLLQYAP